MALLSHRSACSCFHGILGATVLLRWWAFHPTHAHMLGTVPNSATNVLQVKAMGNPPDNTGVVYPKGLNLLQFIVTDFGGGACQKSTAAEHLGVEAVSAMTLPRVGGSPSATAHNCHPKRPSILRIYYQRGYVPCLWSVGVQQMVDVMLI